jgi:hypothetical protein
MIRQSRSGLIFYYQRYSFVHFLSKADELVTYISSENVPSVSEENKPIDHITDSLAKITSEKLIISRCVKKKVTKR